MTTQAVDFLDLSTCNTLHRELNLSIAGNYMLNMANRHLVAELISLILVDVIPCKKRPLAVCKTYSLSATSTTLNFSQKPTLTASV